MMGIHKLTAGDGYLYLLRQVAAADATHKGRSTLSDYYTAKGETPGQWSGRGLAALGQPTRRFHDEATANQTSAKPLTKLERKVKAAAARVCELWDVAAGSEVTEEQMRSLFGLGLHPNATALTTALLQGRAGKAGACDAVKLGRPFRINPGESELQQRLAVAYRDHNLSLGSPWNAPIEDDIRAAMRTSIARELFEAEHHRQPADDRELGGFIARNSRELTTSTAGYDFTFSPVKSVSTLWALAPVQVARIIEDCHDRAVSDALDFLQDTACFTRVGTNGVAQVDTEGFIAARFAHRDSRAGDPDLHTHVAVSNKVCSISPEGAQRWLAIDGRPLFKSTVAASELYNTRLEGYLSVDLGARFTERTGGAEGKRSIREIEGIPQSLIEGFSTRRAAIESKVSDLAKQFQIDHGREPTTPEALALSQQATLETRQAKHEPRSLAEQRQQWRTHAVEILGGPQAINGVVAQALSGRREAAAEITDSWIAESANSIAETVALSRSTWQRTHILAEAQRLVRAAGHAADHDLATTLTDAALCEPFSIALSLDTTAELGEPQQLRRRDGSSVYRMHGVATYTSAEILAAEKRILAAAVLTDGRKVAPAEVDMALLSQAAHRRELNEGQTTLVRTMASSGKRVMLALAPAGAGKTTAMSALARAWEDSGGHVIGLSPSASAAQLLRNEIEVDVADTLDKFNWLAHNAAPGHHDPARDWFDNIDEFTLLIVDEAGKAGTLALDSVVATALARGASVRLIGDDRQLSSISAGGILRDLAETTDSATLSQIVRFASASEAQAGAALRVGDPSGLAFYADHGRIHVGAQDTAAAMAFDAWREDSEQGLDSLLLAPTNDVVTDLNAQARLWRLARAATDPDTEQSSQPIMEARLADGLRASIGDTVVTKDNDRRLRLGRNDFVRNGYRWTVSDVAADGSMTVTHNESDLHMHLPAGYVRSSVRLGYAATIDSAQGATARYRCHTVGHDGLTRQQLYTAVSRGVHANHIYLSTAEHDPHRILSPKATHPETAIDVLTRALARDNAQVSATTMTRRDADPLLRLGNDVLRYADAVGSAAEALLTPAQSAALDANSERIHPGLTRSQAWPVLRKHLALIAANGHNPLQRLSEVAARGDLDKSSDPAAVLDWRLDPSGAHSGGAGPLPWLQAIPKRAHGDREWSDYLTARSTLVVEQVTAIRAKAATWTPATAPRWARPLVSVDTALLSDLAVFRAATKVADEDTRIAGPEQYPDRLRAMQSRLEQRAAAIVGRPDKETARWNQLIDSIDIHIRRDPYWPHLASQLASTARTGVDVQQLLTSAAQQGPLPDELPAAALWWRICGTLSPAALETANPGLRPTWLPDLNTVFGTSLAETMAADPAFPALVSAVATADPHRWTPLELLQVAAEHLRDADANLANHLRPDEYARLLTYSIDLFTTEHPFDHDIPIPAEAPLSQEEEEELHHHHPDPARLTDNAPLDLDHDHDALLHALGIYVDDEPPLDPDEYMVADPYDDWSSDFDSGLTFDDLHPSAAPNPGLQPALADVHALRTQYTEKAASLTALATEVNVFNGPAVQQAMAQVRDIRQRADTDRPYLSAVQEVLAQWSDADEAYEQSLTAMQQARDYVAALRDSTGTDPDDLAAAQQHYDWAQSKVPATPPSVQFWPDLVAAKKARDTASGGAEHIVTHADADAVLAAANNADHNYLLGQRAELARLRHTVARAEHATALAFAAAQLHSADHLAHQTDAIATELRVLQAAGTFLEQPRLTLPASAATALSPMTGAALAAIARTPFVLTVIHASERSTFLRSMELLHDAATEQHRHIHWCDAVGDPDEALTTRIADQRGSLLDTHRQLSEGEWTPTPGTIMVVDHAADAPPTIIADLAEAAAANQTRLLLIDTDVRARWPHPPSAPLLRLLQADLPWSATLAADQSGRRDWQPTGPDLDAALNQAADLDPALHTPEIVEALTRRASLHTEHRTAHQLETRFGKLAGIESPGHDKGRGTTPSS